MIWALLAAVGVPLWLCAIALGTLVFRNRELRRRGDDVPVRVRRSPDGRWARGHAIWVHDVFAFRGSPAAWKEGLVRVTEASLRQATAGEQKGLKGIHRLGPAPVIATFGVEGGQSFEAAARGDQCAQLLGPLRSAAVVVARDSHDQAKAAPHA